MSIQSLDALDSPLRRARLARGLSLGDIADKTGLDISTLSRIEARRTAMARDTARILFDLYDGDLSLEILLDVPPLAEAKRMAAARKRAKKVARA